VLQTEFEFTLPNGYLDENHTLHRDGVMRLATALDEIAPLEDPRVRNNEAYVVIVLLSRVITQLGTLPKVTPQIVERMFAADIAFLQDMYRHINELEDRTLPIDCPNCQHQFEVNVPFLGE
jgi:hypothetical protein